MQAEEFSKTVVKKLLDLKYSLPEGLVVGVGAPLRATDKRVYDVYVLLRRGKILGLSAASAFYNSRDYRVRNFSSATEHTEFVIGTEHLFSSHIFELDGLKLGVLFNPADEEQVFGADVVLNPEAVRYELKGLSKREQYVRELSERLQTLVITANLMGCENGSDIFDGVCLAAKNGELILRSKALSYARERLVNLSEGVQEVLPEIDCLVRAVGLGLFDWMVKTRSHGYALSLSGGADSALCAAAIGYSQLAAFCDLGYADYKEQMESLNFTVEPCQSGAWEFIRDKMLPQVLTTVYQASEVSGEVTRTAACKLASDLGSTHYSWSIAELVREYTRLVNATTPDDPLNYERDDLTLQNIQARSRAPGVWMLANRYNKLLVVTCNASEEAVGYCTMDGDTCGGVAPLACVSKSRILKINAKIASPGLRVNDEVTLQLPHMELVCAQAPTAELRPDQTDERDLMPYVVLDRIHELNQGELLFPQAILSKLTLEFPSYSESELTLFVNKYFRKLCVSQWKRERGATSFHIEPCDLNAKSGFIFPLLNDGFSSFLADFKKQ
ncbi:MAG: NAD(+) synthase [Succinivibrio sp.]|nr:NAD(+) synthase [Succinivibrio sp.]